MVACACNLSGEKAETWGQACSEMERKDKEEEELALQ